MKGIRPGIRWLMRLALRRDHLTREEVDREIDFHLDARAAQLVARGMDPAAARTEARARFGDVEQARERLRRGAIDNEKALAIRERLEAAMDDLRYVFRTLARSRAFSTAVLLTLALGIGANAAMFGIIDRLLLRGPEHVRDPQGLYRLYQSSVGPSGPRQSPGFGYVLYALLRDRAQRLDGVAAYSSTAHTVGSGADAERVEGFLATRDFFDLLGVRPYLGRFFTPEEDLPPFGQRVAVLSHELWQRRFGGDRDAIGSTIRLSGEPFTIVGVLPAGFTGTELRRADVWLPMSLSRTRPDWPTTWNAQWLRIVARPRAGVEAAAAAAEAEQIYQQNYTGRGGAVTATGAELSFLPISATPSGREAPETPVARWLTGVSVVVLLIACANASNLMMARATRRRREVAVRLALGASRWRLARLLVGESVTLALLGCVVGLGFAQWGGQIIRTLLLPNVYWTSMPVSGRVLAYSASVALLAGVFVGLAPILQASRLQLSGALKSGTQQSGVSRSSSRQALVFLQAALSLVLLVGAGLFVRSLDRVMSLDLGFEPDKVVQADLAWDNRSRFGTREWASEAARQVSVYQEIARRLRVTPGVEAAGVAAGTPFGNTFGVDLWVPGRDSIPDLGQGPFISAIEPGYMEAVGMRLLQGRRFGPRDDATSERVAIVNEPMARALWPGENPLTKCLQIFNREVPCARVVGVVAESRRFGLREPSAMQYYVPYGQEIGFGGSAIFARPSGDPRQFAATMRRVILEVDPTLLSTRIRVMREAIDPLTRSWKLGATLFTIFGALALVIAALGLYSVIAYLVAQRTQEFGVRMALGARAADIVTLVLRRGLATVLAGLAAGLLVALLAGPSIAPLLFETSPREGAVILVASALLVGSAVLACWVPAMRAAGVDPAVALRAE